DPGFPLHIGAGVTVGHRAVVHGAHIGDNTLVGMGAIILNGAQVGRNCVIGAGALLTQGKHYPDNALILGSPARAIRDVSESEIAANRRSAAQYVAKAKAFREGYTPR
ncbi:MAG: gamma carbonic anhydrase family protein, partial [Chloroflexi bacterium]